MNKHSEHRSSESPDDWTWREEVIRREWEEDGIDESAIAERIWLARSRWEETQRYAAERGALFAAVFRIITRYNPVGIAFADNADEYEPETRTVVPRLSQANSVGDVRTIIYEEFLNWFGSNYFRDDELDAIAREVWDVTRRYRDA